MARQAGPLEYSEGKERLSAGVARFSTEQSSTRRACPLRTAYLAAALGHATEYLDPVVPGKPS